MKKLQITKERFLDWYFNYGQDSENESIRTSLAEEVIEKLMKSDNGSVTITAEEIFNDSNQEAIRMSFIEGFDDENDDDIELSDYDPNNEYELILID